MSNGINNGLLNGLHGGLANGLTDGLSNGLYHDDRKFVFPYWHEEALVLFSAMTVKPTFFRKLVINKFIDSLKNYGIWQKLDLLYVFDTNDIQAAKLNWINPFGSSNLTSSIPPTFTADYGFTANGTTQYLYANIALKKSTSTSSCLFNYEVTECDFGTNILIGQTLPSVIGSHSVNRHIGNNYVSDRSGTTYVITTIGTSVGMFLTQRDGGTISSWHNGTQINSSAIAATYNLNYLYLFYNNFVASARATTMSLVGTGSKLDNNANLGLAYEEYRKGILNLPK